MRSRSDPVTQNCRTVITPTPFELAVTVGIIWGCCEGGREPRFNSEDIMFAKKSHSYVSQHLQCRLKFPRTE
jgi:hypothetical protein